jgi:Resolvase, N terminal domain
MRDVQWYWWVILIAAIAIIVIAIIALSNDAGGRLGLVAYLRTSSAANVGADKDSDRRQREAITAFASRAGYELVGEFYDAAVSGADPIDYVYATGRSTALKR